MPSIGEASVVGVILNMDVGAILVTGAKAEGIDVKALAVKLEVIVGIFVE